MGTGGTGNTGRLWHGGAGSSMQPGTESSGQPQHREAVALGNRDHLPGTSCQAWHWVWAPGPGHGGAWGGPGGDWRVSGDSSSSGGEHRDTPVPSPVPGVDFKMKTIEVDGIKVRIQIWDTAGQERYQTITKQYYRRAQGIFLVYDISSERSYQHIVKWASDVDEYAPDGVQKILIGNKADEEHKSWPGNTGWISTRPVPAATSTSRSPSHG
ncbi:ras-related protein Rab-15 isoform X2 [Empidonax traillii]|uniref:ras-related protein Rab-15 isoform X2 n=1 Tax=Empidonax traillii TaxID=164674 RepID=UPI000FFD7842|nr:ras-related protein Rab-15 isoform X2 [Empidonax traillii]